MGYFLGLPILGNQDNFVTLAQDAYKKTIGRSDQWIHQKTVLFSTLTLSYWTLERLFIEVFGKTINTENRKPLEENLYKAANSMKKVYDITENLLVEKELVRSQDAIFISSQWK